MKILHTIPVLMMTAFLFSCGKEQSVEKKEQAPVDSTGTIGDGTLLVRKVAREEAAADSIVTTFMYNAQKKITIIKAIREGAGNMAYGNLEYRFYRNNNGMVDRYVEYATYYNNGVPLLTDSMVYLMHYNDQGKYTYAIRTYQNFGGTNVRDSVVYGYASNGRINVFQSFHIGDDAQYFEQQRTEYVYDNRGNITTETILFRDNASSTDPAQLFNLEYDNKISPMNFGDEFLFSGFQAENLTSPSNLIKIEEIGGDEPQFITYTFSYNSHNKPVTGLRNEVSSSSKANIFYYYN